MNFATKRRVLLSPDALQYTAPMQIYMVGGAVRDALMGLPVTDRDWVVVGATPEDLVKLGYLPVGRDFPVFLHPDTREEYALARTERKTAPGYRGFAIHAAPDVTLEQDLARRDLTINSIAIDINWTGAGGQIDIKKEPFIDPFDGRGDIERKVLRHVSDAFREDPVRILRVARLAARFSDFTVAPETLQLMREMVQHGEADHLVRERVWQEVSRGLMAQKPSRMFEVLRACEALPRLFPEVQALNCSLQSGVLDLTASLQAPLPVRFACLCIRLQPPAQQQSASQPSHAVSKPACWLEDLTLRLRVPTPCSELANVVLRERGAIDKSSEIAADAMVDLLDRCDAFRKPARLADILQACKCLALDDHAETAPDEPPTDIPYPAQERVLKALAAGQSVATTLIAYNAITAGATGQEIGENIRRARIDAVAKALGT